MPRNEYHVTFPLSLSFSLCVSLNSMLKKSQQRDPRPVPSRLGVRNQVGYSPRAKCTDALLQLRDELPQQNSKARR